MPTKKTILSLLLAVVMVFTTLPFAGVWAVEDEPEEPELFFNDNSAFDFQTTSGPKKLMKKVQSYPEEFDLRDEGCVTSVKFQNPFGSCWGFAVALFDGDTLLQKGDAETVSFDAGNMTASRTFTARIVDADGNVQSDAEGKPEKQIEVTVKTGFFARLAAFFRGLFGIRLNVALKP